jgi:cyclopropane-fatty-acyl-phospholipid synthase
MPEAAIADAPAETKPPPPHLPLALRRAPAVADLVKVGSLTLQFPDGATYRATGADGPDATIVLRHSGAVRRLLAGQALGLAEAYIDGWWTTPDLRAVMALAAANESDWAELTQAPVWLRGWGYLLDRLRRLRPAVLLRRRRRDAGRTYQLDADFYGSWLDATMTQSAAIFAGDGNLEAAQLRKIHRLCRLMRLIPGNRVLDLGCGWGSFAEVAARDYGCGVIATTTTPSHFEYTTERISQAGLSHRVEVRMQDYRDLTGRFDRIVAIETFNALPEEDWPLYFKTVHDRLGSSGVAAFQVATISDRLFESHRDGEEFIGRYISPRGPLPSRSRLRRAFQKAGMAWGEEHWFARDYAETMVRWQAAFQSAWPRIEATTRGNRHPCDARFKRLWEYYLAYCELGFRSGWMDVGQILIARNG